MSSSLSFIKRLTILVHNSMGYLKYKIIKTQKIDKTDTPSRYDTVIRIGVPLKPYSTPVSLLHNLDLKIGKKVGADQCYIDLSGSIVEPALFALHKACRDNGENLFIVNGKRTLIANTETIREIPRNKSFIIIIADRRDRASGVYIINIWRDEVDSLRCFSDNLPLSIVSKNHDVIVPTQTDTSTDFPVDFVYTWVNGDDPDWIKLISPFKTIDNSDRDRFSQADELKYSLRSVMTYAPWVRKIYILSNCKPPTWLSTNPKIEWVLHEKVIPKEFLPTFNSHAIETFLHKIPDLSENFIYMNDDVMISRLTHKLDFFDHAGRAVSRLEPYGAVAKLIGLKQMGNVVEWQSAAINSGEMIKEKFGFFPTRLHRHAPFSLQKSLYQEIELEFPEEMENTRRARFRQHTDVSFTSFLYHHYAAEVGRGIRATAKSVILNPRNHSSFEQNYWRSKVDYFCVNDGSGSSYNPNYCEFKKTFLSKAFPIRASWENFNE